MICTSKSDIRDNSDALNNEGDINPTCSTIFGNEDDMDVDINETPTQIHKW